MDPYIFLEFDDIGLYDHIYRYYYNYKEDHLTEVQFFQKIKCNIRLICQILLAKTSKKKGAGYRKDPFLRDTLISGPEHVCRSG